MKLCEKEEYRGCTINVYHDDTPEDPRTWDNVATFVCEHRRYNLGDEQDIEGRIDSLFSEYVPAKAVIDHFVKTRDAHLVPGEGDDYCDQYYEYKKTIYGEEYTCYIGADTSDSDDSIASDMVDRLDVCEKMSLLENTGEVVTLPISMYEHSGISLWLGSKWGHPDAQWDCSSIGFAFVEKKTAEREMPQRKLTDEQKNDWKKWAYAMMEGEMETYNKYVSGEVYGYRIEDEEGEEASDVHLCGCWGFYDKDHLLEYAKNDIDTYLEKKRETRKNNLETLVKNIAFICGTTFTDGDYMYRVAKDMFGFDYIERAKICKGIVRAYVQIGFSNLNDEILNDMVEQINKKVA